MKYADRLEFAKECLTARLSDSYLLPLMSTILDWIHEEFSRHDTLEWWYIIPTILSMRHYNCFEIEISNFVVVIVYDENKVELLLSNRHNQHDGILKTTYAIHHTSISYADPDLLVKIKQDVAEKTEQIVSSLHSRV